MSERRLDGSHDPGLRSWVDSANQNDGAFPIQNLPFGIFSTDGDAPRAGVAIGGEVLDIAACAREGLLGESEAVEACSRQSLNALMSLPAEATRSLRRELSTILRADTEAGKSARRLSDRILHPIAAVEMHLPAQVGDYTDFYASIQHATNVGSMFRPDNPLLPNYKHVPIGYHGRSSSIVVSGTGIRRPHGQTKAADADVPVFGESRMLDYESELGFFVRGANEIGATVGIANARDRIFGFCLVNDWSARDIQAWEYQPLGPFLAKNFATTISPWVVTSEAVEPYRRSVPSRPDGDPPPLDYIALPDAVDGAIGAFLEVLIQSRKMREAQMPPARLSRASFAGMYWTVEQMLAHHASNGCNLRPGDLLASGTVSGDSPDSRGCLLELTWRGRDPVRLPSGEERRFLEEGDEVIMRGALEAAGRPTIGFGECRGTVLPANT